MLGVVDIVELGFMDICWAKSQSKTIVKIIWIELTQQTSYNYLHSKYVIFVKIPLKLFDLECFYAAWR
jgi:hypothetical protein